MAEQKQAAGADAMLEVRDLHTWFDTPRGLVRAVDGVSLRLDAGKTIGIVGESGSGKSVLARSIMHLLPPNAIVPRGEVLLDGRDIGALTPKEAKQVWGREIAMVFQDPMTTLNPVVRVGRHITEAVSAHGRVSKPAARQRALELLTAVGIPEPDKRLRVYPHEMSGGMRQRVSIAIALACSPRVLIADEPTTALDVTIQRQILDLLSTMQRDSSMSMLIVSHDLGVVAGRADEVAVMYAGRVIERATTANLFKQTRHPYTEALLRSIPRLEHETHRRLPVIPGRPAVVTTAAKGCRFAPRCRYAQARCLVETPANTTLSVDHEYACFYPVGTPEGEAALARNQEATMTAAGTRLSDFDAVI